MSPPAYSLRPATDDDYDFLYRLHVATIKAAVEATWGWDDAFQQERFRLHWNPSNRHIVMVGDVDIGTITFEQRPEAILLALIEINPASSSPWAVVPKGQSHPHPQPLCEDLCSSAASLWDKRRIPEDFIGP